MKSFEPGSDHEVGLAGQMPVGDDRAGIDLPCDEVHESPAPHSRPIMTATRIYLDHHATTPVDPHVAAVVMEAMTVTYGNANSVHHAYGREAARRIDLAAGQVASLVGSEAEDVRFTSGASEALRLALAYASERRDAPLRVAASTIEHPALIEELERGAKAGWFELHWMEVGSDGVVMLTAVADALDWGAHLVCLMAANNEVGTLQPIEAAASLVGKAGGQILVDGTQAAGRIPLASRDWEIDYLVLSGHKLYGPKGVGALVGMDLAATPPPSRYAFHDATPNVPGIAGLGEACRLCEMEMPTEHERVGRLRDWLQDRLLSDLPEAEINGSQSRRLAANLHLSLRDVPGDAVVEHLADKVAISTGAACVSGSDAPSHVLRAMRLPPWRQEGALRISLGRFTTMDDVDRAALAIVAAVADVRAVMGTSK